MRLFLSAALLVCVSMTAVAHHPDRENQPVRPRIEVIPPLGTSLKMSHRRKYNRPTNWGGKLMYYIAPSSQEAMAWHNATHRGYYENDSPRIVTHYFYPKPWESLVIGPRPRTVPTEAEMAETGGEMPLIHGDMTQPLAPEETLPLPIEPEAIEAPLPAPTE